MFTKSLVGCRVRQVKWISPTVFTVRFSTKHKLDFQAGQFLSVLIPTQSAGHPQYRCYSIATSPDQKKKHAYMLCIKFRKGGIGSCYMSQLKKGDVFHARAAFGRFQFHKPEDSKHVVFIATGTGIAPIYSMISSEDFKEFGANQATLIFGTRSESEILLKKRLSESGIHTVYTVSQPSRKWNGFCGRVTDYLKQLPADVDWQHTEFYICGSGEMVRSVKEILIQGHGVNPKVIHAEAFSPQ